MEKVRIAVLCSGGGTNFQAIENAAEAGMLPHGEIVLVLSDHADAYVLKRAKGYGIKTEVFDKAGYPDRNAREAAMIACLKAHQIGLVVLAGFMTILSETFVGEFRGRTINIHPALLPSFGGKGMYGLHVHEAALKAGVKVTGATVHFVTGECDAGPIIAQKAVEVKDGDTPETLQKRVMREAEWVIFPQAVEEVAKNICKENE